MTEIERIREVAKYLGRSSAIDIQEELDDCCNIVEKKLKAFEKLKQHIKEEYKRLINAMQRNFDFSDEEDVIHYEKLKAQAYILNKFLKEVLEK